MAAKAFAYAVGCPLIAVPTFEIIARQTTLKCLALEVISDALKDKLYAQRFRRDELDQSWIVDEPLAVVRREKWLSALRPGSGVTGPGVEVVRSDVPGALMVAPSAERAPALPELLATASARFGTTRPGSISALEPIYLRPSSAEEQWDARTGSA